MGKIVETEELYKNTVNRVTQSPDNWLSFLDSASWNFKYDFDDQILIYAQNPQARACATMKEWNNKVRPSRWVNKGAKSIFVLDKTVDSQYPFKLVFDIADTHNSNNTEYKLWEIKKKYEQEIIETLESCFGETYTKEKQDIKTMEKAINRASCNLTNNNIQDYLQFIQNHKIGTKLENLENQEIEIRLNTTVMASVRYMIMTRCGINPKNGTYLQDFSYINNFNDWKITTTLGQAVSEIAETAIREIAETVISLQKSENLKKRTIENINKEMYSKDNKIEGGIKNGTENRIHETGQLLYAKPSNEERKDTSRKIRSNEIQLSKELPKTRIDNIDDETRIDETLKRNSRGSKPESTEISGTNAEKARNNGRIESQRPDDMGRTHERAPVRCLIYSRWKSYLVRSNQPLVPRFWSCNCEVTA